MTETAMSIQDFFEQYIRYPWENFRVWDVLDWLLLTVLFYGVYLFCRGRIAGRVTVGLVLLWLFYYFTERVGLIAVHRLMSCIAPFTVVLLAVIYQPELRDALARIGSTAFGFRTAGQQQQTDTTNTINEVVDAACQIAMTAKDGALIVIERGTPLGDFTDKGYEVDAVVSSELLCTIFKNLTPLHDGAVIIRNNRVVAAGSKLPLGRNADVVVGMGTRHRAAVGITEISDCVVVVVSEERHVISIANNGYIKKYNRSEEDFRNEVTNKSVRRQLQRDLTGLLTGMTLDENGKPESIRVRLEFKWGFGLDKEDRERRLRAREEAEREREREQKNREEREARRSAYKVTAHVPVPQNGGDTPENIAEGGKNTPGNAGMSSIHRASDATEGTAPARLASEETAPEGNATETPAAPSADAVNAED